MSITNKDSILGVITKHSFIVEQEQLEELNTLIDDYIPVATNLLRGYMKRNNLCFSVDEEGNTAASKILALACFVTIIFSSEVSRKKQASVPSIGSGLKVRSHSAGAYSQSYDSQTTEFFESISKSPLACFLRSALIKCNSGVGIRLVSSCKDYETQQSPVISPCKGVQ